MGIAVVNISLFGDNLKNLQVVVFIALHVYLQFCLMPRILLG